MQKGGGLAEIPGEVTTLGGLFGAGVPAQFCSLFQKRAAGLSSGLTSRRELGGSCVPSEESALRVQLAPSSSFPHTLLAVAVPVSL